MKAGSGEGLLVIDDDMMNLELVKVYLEDYGFTIHLASNGRSGLELARSKQPDLIILDVQMPGMDGFAVCQRLKKEEQTRHIPVVFFSMYGDSKQKVRGFELGAVDFISKPMQQQELVARVLNHLKFEKIKRNLEKRLALYQQYYGPIPENGMRRDTARLSRLALQRIEQIRQQLLKRPGNPPTLEELGNEFGINPKRLSREFQAVHGLTLFAWLRDYRLCNAANMLRESDRSVEEIARTNGYTCGANFATAFKRRFQVSPREYRKTEIEGGG